MYKKTYIEFSKLNTLLFQENEQNNSKYFKKENKLSININPEYSEESIIIINNNTDIIDNNITNIINNEKSKSEDYPYNPPPSPSSQINKNLHNDNNINNINENNNINESMLSMVL